MSCARVSEKEHYRSQLALGGPALENIVVRRARQSELLGTFERQVHVVQLEFGGEGMWIGDVHEIVIACLEPEEFDFCIGCGHWNSLMR